MLRLKTNETFKLKSVRDNSVSTNKAVFMKKNRLTINKLAIGEELSYNGYYTETGEHFEETKGKVVSFSCLENKVFVSTENETYIFLVKKA